MFCTKCGSKVAEGATFCGQCGAPLNGKVVSTAEEAVIPVTEEAAVPAAEEAAPVAEAAPVVAAVPAEKPAKKKKKTGLIITIILLALVVIAAIVVIIFINSPGFKHDRQIKKAQACMQTEDYEGAFAAYEAALEIDENSAEAEDGIVDAGLELADKYYEAGSYKEALDTYERVLDIERKNKSAKSGIEKTYLALAVKEKEDGNFEKALEYCEDAEDVRQDGTIATDTKIEIYYAWSDAEAAAGNYDEALNYCETAYYMGGSYETYEEKRADVYLAWGDNLLKEGDYEEAMKQYERAKYIDYGNENIYVKIAEAYLTAGEVNAAVEELGYGMDNCSSTDKLESKCADIVANTTYEVRDSYINGWDHYETGTFTFDENGNITKQSAVNYFTGTVESEYDTAGNRIKTIKYDEGGNVIYTYTEQTTDSGYKIEEYAYKGGAEATQIWNSLTIYDAQTNSKSYVKYDIDGDAETVVNTYYDANGNVIEEECYSYSDFMWGYDYVYDENNVLIQQTYHDWYGDATVKEITYEEYYDEEGRLTTKKLYGNGDVLRTYYYDYHSNGTLAGESVTDEYGGYSSYKYYDIFGNCIEEYDENGLEEFYNTSWGYNQTVYTLTYDYSYQYNAK